MMTFTFQFYNKNTGEQRGTGSIYAASFREAEAKARSGLQGAGWQMISNSKL